MTWIPWTRAVIAVGLLVGLSMPIRAAGPYTEEELRVPVPTAGLRGLEALLVRPSEPGRYPLALLNHGAPRFTADRPNMTPWSMLPQAIEFARRGWAAVMVMRQGYGDSGGIPADDYGSCGRADYIAAGNGASAELKESLRFSAGGRTSTSRA